MVNTTVLTHYLKVSTNHLTNICGGSNWLDVAGRTIIGGTTCSSSVALAPITEACRYLEGNTEFTI